MSDIPIKVSTSTKLTGHIPDGDYTQDFLDAGTMFSAIGTVNASGVPVTKAWVKDDVLYVEGNVICDPDVGKQERG